MKTMFESRLSLALEYIVMHWFHVFLTVRKVSSFRDISGEASGPVHEGDNVIFAPTEFLRNSTGQTRQPNAKFKFVEPSQL